MFTTRKAARPSTASSVEDCRRRVVGFVLSYRMTGVKVGGLARDGFSPGEFSLTIVLFLKLLIILTGVISVEGRLRRSKTKLKVQPPCICNG